MSAQTSCMSSDILGQTNSTLVSVLENFGLDNDSPKVVGIDPLIGDGRQADLSVITTYNDQNEYKCYAKEAGILIWDPTAIDINKLDDILESCRVNSCLPSNLIFTSSTELSSHGVVPNSTELECDDSTSCTKNTSLLSSGKEQYHFQHHRHLSSLHSQNCNIHSEDFLHLIYPNVNVVSDVLCFEDVLQLIHDCNYQKAQVVMRLEQLQFRGWHPKRPNCLRWDLHEIELFERSMVQYQKQFGSIQSIIKTKNVADCIEFYFLWKHTPRHAAWMARKMGLPRPSTQPDGCVDSNTYSNSFIIHNSISGPNDQASLKSLPCHQTRKRKRDALGTVITVPYCNYPCYQSLNSEVLDVSIYCASDFIDAVMRPSFLENGLKEDLTARSSLANKIGISHSDDVVMDFSALLTTHSLMDFPMASSKKFFTEISTTGMTSVEPASTIDITPGQAHTHDSSLLQTISLDPTLATSTVMAHHDLSSQGLDSKESHHHIHDGTITGCISTSSLIHGDGSNLPTGEPFSSDHQNPFLGEPNEYIAPPIIDFSSDAINPLCMFIAPHLSTALHDGNHSHLISSPLSLHPPGTKYGQFFM